MKSFLIDSGHNEPVMNCGAYRVDINRSKACMVSLPCMTPSCTTSCMRALTQLVTGDAEVKTADIKEPQPPDTSTCILSGRIRRSVSLVKNSALSGCVCKLVLSMSLSSASLSSHAKT